MKKPSLKAPKLKISRDESGGERPSFKATALTGGGARTGQSLLAAAVVLAAVFGIAELRPPVTPAAAAVKGAATTAQVERTSLVCPQPLQGLTGSTSYTLFSPAGAKATGGAGYLSDVAQPPATPAASPAPSGTPGGAPSGSRLVLTKPGVPATGPAATGDTAPGTLAVATGGYAPGFSVTQTTTVTDQSGVGMSGINCTPAGTSFWFSGVSTAGDRVDYVSLVNADSVPAVVDLKLYGDKGPIDNDAATGITLPAGSSQDLRLPTFAQNVNDLALHVIARSGRVGAAVHATDGTKGADWIPASVEPTSSVVLPGLPADMSAARLVIVAPGDDDADLKIQISGKNGWFTPAGHETIHVKAGMIAATDLQQVVGGTTQQVNRGEVGALRLTPSDPAHPTPIVASIRVDRSQNGKSDAAWITGSALIGQRAGIAENRGGGAGTLYLTSSGDAAKVKVSVSAGSGGGTPASQEVSIPAGATVGMQVPEPAGLNGVFGLTVETESGGPVVAARMLAVNVNNIPMFTIQPLRDDHSTVQVPQADQDPGVLIK
ncbi:DUF5719 family protein [Kitasatospora sp. MAP5-34]|uniref:DUF5719 family protein n=1 Tax=Kitasatospora sp. MAP5-34 TaxID=3035102 RepID=UPI0024754E75|nr:DUF5719 family protein [Kitasatospora sp. MAP5-34]MDH6580058.1 hypothetical protein [Kitasatospora sp. MAP5-34]